LFSNLCFLGGAADNAGMLVGDRVVEVNGVNVEAMSHSEVVEQIRGNSNKTKLLVVDKVTENYLKKINRPITESLCSYTSVHEITIEEAEKLEQLKLNEKDDENEEDEAIPIEEKTTSPPTSPTLSIESEKEREPERELTPPPPREPTPPPPREPTPPPPREPTPPPVKESSSPSINEKKTEKSESKKDMLKRMMKPPKRKEVKNSSDWKTKLNDFNNL